MQAQVKMIVKTTGGTSKEYVIDDIGKMAFSNDALNIFGKETSTYSLSDLLSIKFDLATGISATQSENEQMKFDIRNNMLSVSGINGTANAAIFSVNGQQMTSLRAWNGAPVSIANLPKGVYILNIKNQSFKFIR
jgi:hypothetical protein